MAPSSTADGPASRLQNQCISNPPEASGWKLDTRTRRLHGSFDQSSRPSLGFRELLCSPVTQSAGGKKIPQGLSGVSSSIPYRPSDREQSQTTHAPSDLPLVATVMHNRMPDCSPGIVLIKAPCLFTTKVFPTAWKQMPVLGCIPAITIRITSGIRELRRLTTAG